MKICIHNQSYFRSIRIYTIMYVHTYVDLNFFRAMYCLAYHFTFLNFYHVLKSQVYNVFFHLYCEVFYIAYKSINLLALLFYMCVQFPGVTCMLLLKTG